MALSVAQMHFEEAEALLGTVDKLLRVCNQKVSTEGHGATP